MPPKIKQNWAREHGLSKIIVQKWKQINLLGS